jgi:hypothetical protein
VPIREIEQLEKGEKSVDGMRFTKALLPLVTLTLTMKNYMLFSTAPPMAMPAGFLT